MITKLTCELDEALARMDEPAGDKVLLFKCCLCTIANIVQKLMI